MSKLNINKIEESVNNSKSIRTTSKALVETTSALDKLCNNVSKILFDYKFSKYLYYHYIILNETKYEISEQLNIHPSTIYYYIRKYNIKKDIKLKNEKMLNSIQKTCMIKYNVNHPGKLKESHKKRVENIIRKSNDNYNKYFYPKLNKCKINDGD